MDEWDRYVADQKYARSLRNNAEAGFIRGLKYLTMMIAPVMVIVLVLATLLWR